MSMTATDPARARDPTALTLRTTMVTEDPIAKGARLFAERLEELSGRSLTMGVYDGARLFARNADGDAPARGQSRLAETGFSGCKDLMPCASMFTSGWSSPVSWTGSGRHSLCIGR
jgi:TRAP-type C4-dicarboxylate transport system substrate-binding protein